MLVREVLVHLPHHLRRRVHWARDIARLDVGNGLVGLVLKGSRFWGLRFFLQSVQLFRHFADSELSELDYAIFVRREPLHQFLAADPLSRLCLTQALDEQHQRRTVTIILLQLRQPFLQFFVLELVIGLVESARVGERGSVETGESD